MARAQYSVLVVDDSESVRLVVALMLDAQGYLVEVAHNRDEALQRIQLRNFDVILIDVNLGHDSGAVLAEDLLQDSQNHKIVLTTGLPDLAPEMAHHPCLSALPVLYKPFARQQLMEAVRKAVGLDAA